MKLIKSDLNLLGIKHDNFYSETKLIKYNMVNKRINILKKDKLVLVGFLDKPKSEDSSEWKKTKRGKDI